MIGHGRPSSWKTASARNAAGLALTLCAVFFSAAAAQQSPVSETVRLRITWGGGEPTRWFGHIRVDGGSLSNLKLLGTAADSAGSVWLEKGHVRVATLSAHNDDAIEITTSPADASQLLVELSTNAANAPLPIKVPLPDVLRRPYELRLDDRGNMLRIETVSNETLRIVMDRDTLIFAPSEQFSFQLHPRLPDMAPRTTLDIRTTLSPGRRNEVVWSDEQRLEVPVEGAPIVKLTLPLPRTEGAYTLRVSATQPPGFRPRFFPGAAATLAERRFDLVVLDSRAPQPSPSSEWQSVLEIDPTNPRWSERLPNWTQLRRIPGFNRLPLGSIRAGAVDLSLGRFVELPPTVAGSDPHWQAYSLPLEAVDTPHILEIDYPADGEQHFGLSIVEPNAAGVVSRIDRGGGVYVEGFGRAESAQVFASRIPFWPRTQAPLLLVTNQHPTAAAHFGLIRVLKRGSGKLNSNVAASSPTGRLVAAYVARPLVAESFGASEESSVMDRTTTSAAKTTDDWQTTYESATRLADYLRYGGYNSAVVNVLAEGSSIYPSSIWMPTPLYNSGRAAKEPVERDGLELLLRVFQREGLAVIPALQFASPLPELEELRRGSNPQTSGLEWVGPYGKTWLETHGSTGGLAPYYNLLEPRVQQALLNAVRELVDRYGKNSAFAGVAIQLSAVGYAQLPPLDWGLDDATVARFESDTGIQLIADGPDRFAARHALLTGEHAAAWRSWRAEQVAKFYGQVAALVRRNKIDRRLILTLEESFDHPQLAARVRPNLLDPNRVQGALIDAGIDRQRLEKAAGVTVCATQYVESMTPLSQRAIDIELNDAFADWQQSAHPAGAKAALLYHRPQRARLPSFTMKSPFNTAGECEIVCHTLAHGHAVRQPYARVLMYDDPAVVIDGGELLPLGQEDMLRAVRSILCQLPAAADVTELVKQPLIVRSYKEPSRVTLLIVNACPWRVDADVMLEVPQATTIEPLATSDEENSPPQVSPSTIAAGRQPWSLSLEPYAIHAVRLASPNVRVAEIRAAVSNSANAEIGARLADLTNRDLTVPRAYPTLINPSFEPLGGAGPVAGWQLTAKAAVVELDATNPKDGKTCLYFRGDGGLASLECDPFPAPATGQLAMTVHVRDQKLAPGAELRMVFEAVNRGHVYRRLAVVAPPNPDSKLPIDGWQSKAILVNDLPIESQGEIQVKFELTGAGEVWLDTVSLYDLLFPLKFYKYERAEILQFLQLTHAGKSAFDAGQIADCVRLLDGYWPRFLATYPPVVQPIVADQPAPNPQAQLPRPPNQAPEANPGVGEQIKRLFQFR